MEASGELNASAALPLWTEPSITFEYEDVWASVSVYMFCRKGKSLAVVKKMNIHALKQDLCFCKDSTLLEGGSKYNIRNVCLLYP
jgi:hypothetical protein